MNDDELEQLSRENPEIYRALLNTLPDVRDGLNRQQRALLTAMNRLGLTSESRTRSAAYVTLNTPYITTRPYEPEIRTHLKEVRFTDETGADLPAPETWYTPDLFDE